MKKSWKSKWAMLGMLLLCLILLSAVILPNSTNSSPPAGQVEKLSSEEDITVTIEALIDGPRVCFARVLLDGEDKYVNLGQYPACQEHKVGQEITVKPEDIDDLENMEGVEGIGSH